MPYPVVLGGDHAAFEAEWAARGRPDHERPDWPLPSFDAQDWAKEFCRIATDLGYRDSEGKPIDEGWMISWFANALMRGYDQRSSEIDINRRPLWLRILRLPVVFVQCLRVSPRAPLLCWNLARGTLRA